MASFALLAGLYPDDDLKKYFIRQRCGPRPGMRRVEERAGSYAYWLYENYSWTLKQVVRDRHDAVSWWLGDPWLPNQQFGHRNLSDGHHGPARNSALAGGAVRDEAARDDAGSGEAAWDAARWADAAAALSFHLVTETGQRTHDVGPESTETGAHVYQRLRAQDAAAQIYWYEGRSQLDDRRASCPVRTDIDPVLRCVVLAEAIVLLKRRPHVDAYIGIGTGPAGVAADASAVLRQFSLPWAAYRLLIR
jgi:hypothetical protein